jgi:hypothetical protein
MTGSVNSPDGKIAQGEFFTVRGIVHFIVCIGQRAVNDRGAGLVSQVNMSAYEIRVKMGFENVTLSPYRVV